MNSSTARAWLAAAAASLVSTKNRMKQAIEPTLGVQLRWPTEYIKGQRCEVCGGVLIRNHTNQARRFCSKECRSHRHAHYRRAA